MNKLLQLFSHKSSAPAVIHRSPFPLTDEQVIRLALKTVNEYANLHPEDRFNANECIDMTISSVEKIWRTQRNYSQYAVLKQEDLNEIATILERIGPDLIARAYNKITECLKRRKIQQINMSTAEALIVHELRKRKLKYFFFWQKYRVKVCIRMDCGSAITAIIKYKDIREGKLPEMIDRIMEIADLLNRTDFPISVWPLDGGWKTYNGWKL